MEQRRNERVVEMGDPRENPPTCGIVRHDSHLRKSRSDPAGELGCEVSFATGSQLIRHTLGDSEPIADLQGKK
ncbi:hypothetical protein PR048_022349 [Dryococelus australis]|uniref:Uncharacterized protein n=1 Tax=Dryococelus australis TaxID=614101 RepID=A0ABQ9H0R0_9NEOP|nr:hypothetical protein PR048_022349 [Dryococelus australis]